MQASRVDFGAKARLSLEADVRRISAELATLRTLVDLLEASTSGRGTDLDLRELMQSALAALAPNGARGRLVQASLVLPETPLSVYAEAPVCMQLIALTMALLADAGTDCVQLSAAADERFVVVRIRRASQQTGAKACMVPIVLGTTSEVAQLAAAEIGALLSLDLPQECRLMLPVTPAAP